MSNNIFQDNKNLGSIETFVNQKQDKIKPKKLTVRPDFIFTMSGNNSTCCLATQIGLFYGINSKNIKQICPMQNCRHNHKVIFIDNDYFKYDHQKHLEAIKQYRPKYCTVRDVMTQEQCLRDGIEYYSPEQILGWAIELSEYAENVIIIPKDEQYLEFFDWSKYMIGVPIPTTHGGDVLNIKHYIDKRCHLLGGSWARQLTYLHLLGDDCVSIDNNYVNKIAKAGCYTLPSGEMQSLKDTLNFNNDGALYTCLSLSFGSINYALNKLISII
jgi:hypothetical protein